MKLYEEIRDDILNDLKNGTYEIGCLIPKETELAAKYDVSRPTVRQAIKPLVNDGYLYRIAGKGTFVKNNKISQEFTHIIKSFNDEMINKGMIPSTNVVSLEAIIPSSEIKNLLQLKNNSKIIKLSRLRFANNEPLVFLNTYIPYENFELLLNLDFSNTSLYYELDSLGYKINKVSRNLEIKKSNYLLASLLNMDEGDPVYFFKTMGYHYNSIIEYSEAWYNGLKNSFKFEIDLT